MFGDLAKETYTWERPEEAAEWPEGSAVLCFFRDDEGREEYHAENWWRPELMQRATRTYMRSFALLRRGPDRFHRNAPADNDGPR